MVRIFKQTIGELKYNEEHKFFYGFINGLKTTMNKVTDKEGKTKFLVNQEVRLYEVTENKNTNDEDVGF